MEPRLAYHTAPTPVETSTSPNWNISVKEPIRYNDILLCFSQKVKSLCMKNL
nr:MAG TPA_asm: hypothetical protein [Caudoviricetes sp.]